MLTDYAKYEGDYKSLLDLDLPGLTSIISVGNSFCSPRLLTLESSG